MDATTRRRRRMVVSLPWLIVATGAVAASTYKVNLHSELNGLDLKVETVEQSGGLVVRIGNGTAQKVRCKLRVDAQPQPLMRKTVYIEAGRSEDTPFLAKRQWFEVDVTVECTVDPK